mmetsp:Transcript_62236/g.148507  ORF Transcript_62236/g.148507 Transcript_62236/m.148507 type:complete len:388 (-) Transcript_62236:323-1486(-)
MLSAPLQNLQAMQPLARRLAPSCSWQASVGPVVPIGCRLIVQEDRLEPLSTHSPINTQVTDEEPTGAFATHVVAIASSLQFSHEAIDEREAGRSRDPRIQPALILRPSPRRLRVPDATDFEDACAGIQTGEADEVSPEHLMRYPICGLCLAALALVAANFFVQSPWRDAAMRQPRRQLRHGLVSHAAFGWVSGHSGANIVKSQAIVIPEEFLDSRQGGGLSASPKQLGSGILVAHVVVLGFVVGTHDLLQAWQTHVALRPPHFQARLAGLDRWALAGGVANLQPFHSLPECSVRVERSMPAFRIEVQVVVVVQFKAPEKVQIATTRSPQHICYLALDSKFLAANLMEGEHGIDNIVLAQLLKALGGADVAARGEVVTHGLQSGLQVR